MITLRRYLFFVLAVCTALAAGIALGGGPLQGRLEPDEQAVSSRTSQLSQTITSLRRQQLFDDAVSEATTRRVVRDQLAGRTVALLVLPTVPDSTVAGVSGAIAQAGATVTVRAHLSPDLIDPAKKAYVDSVADGSLQGRDDLPQLAGAPTYERISALVARAYVGRGQDTEFDEEAADIHAELEGARLVSTREPPLRRGALVFILAPGAATTRSAAATASNVISAQFATTVAAASDGALVAAPPSASSPGGLLTALAKAGRPTDVPLSTLNVIASPAGRIAAVYALAATANGQPWEFGTSPSGIRLPPGLAPVED